MLTMCMKEKTAAMKCDTRYVENRLPVATVKPMVKMVAIGPVPHAHEIGEFFKANGFEIVFGLSAKDTRKQAVKLGASLVILPAHDEPESGWLSCIKLVRTGKKRKVILIGDVGDREAAMFAKFAGAYAYLTVADGAEAVWNAATAMVTK
jgi:hypothetical protein